MLSVVETSHILLVKKMKPFNLLNKNSPRSLDYARDDKINTPNDIGHVMLSGVETSQTIAHYDF